MSSIALSSTFTKKTENFSFQETCTLKSTLESWSWRVSQLCHWLFLPHPSSPFSPQGPAKAVPVPCRDVVHTQTPWLLSFYLQGACYESSSKILVFSSASPVNIIPSISQTQGQVTISQHLRTRKTRGPGTRRSESQVSPSNSQKFPDRSVLPPSMCLRHAASLDAGSLPSCQRCTGWEKGHLNPAQVPSVKYCSHCVLVEFPER